jgi:uncharacterized phage-associated protein
MTDVRYQPTKFREALLYLAAKTGADERCGDKKLNKLLYFADVTAFRRSGQAITGAQYRHLSHGPIATPFIPVRRKLKAEGKVKERKRPYFNHVQTCTEVVGEVPAATHLTPDEVAILDEVVSKYWAYDGNEIENAAHEDPGWALTREQELIPYRTMLIGKKASPAAVTIGRDLAGRFGW